MTASKYIYRKREIKVNALNWVKQNVAVYGEDDMPDGYNLEFSPDGQTVALVNKYSPTVLLSYDSGENWEEYSGLNNLPFTSGNAMKVALTNGSSMYVFTSSHFYKHNRNTGISTEIYPDAAFRDNADYINYYSKSPLTTDGTGRYVCFTTYSASTSKSGQYNGVYISDDYGSTWTCKLNYYTANKVTKYVHRINSTGQYMAALIIDEYFTSTDGHVCLHTSNDYGATWDTKFDVNVVTEGIYRYEETLAVDDDNTSIYTSYYTGTWPNYTINYRLSNDSGANWSTGTITAINGINVGFLVTDYSGQYLIYDSFGTDRFLSQNYGGSWTQYTASDSNNVYKIKPTGHDIWCVFPGATKYSTNWFTSWTSMNPLAGELVIADWLTKVNSDGTKFLAAQYKGGYAYLSTGNNVWTKANIAGGDSLNIRTCAVSGNGQYMFVGEHGGRLYLSANGGATWSETRPSQVDEDLIWGSVAINYSGQYMLAGDWGNDSLYFSSDYGATWTLADAGNGYCDAACINDSGSVLAAAGWGGTFISINYGANWTANSLSARPEYPQGVSCTALGDIMYLSCQPDDYTLRSTDYGATWTELTPNNESFYSTCSDDDGIVLIADHVDGLKSSTDKVNWETELPTMFDVSSNSTGGVIICGQADGYVYIFTTIGFEFYSNHVVLHLAEPVCLKVLGYPLFDDVRVHSYKNTTQGATVNVISIDDATLVSADIAADVLAKTAEYFNLRYQQDVTLFPDPAIKPCDIRTVSSLYGKCVDGITEKLEGNLTGGYLTATKFVGRERMEN